MTSMLLSTLLLLTIVFAFAIGIALGRWAIFGILHFFDPARLQRKEGRAQALATVTGTDWYGVQQ
jgi:hypothetical protein